MSHFINHGVNWHVSPEASLNITTKLPVGNYRVRRNEMTGELFFEKIADFELPTKLYGTCLKSATRILNTFIDRNKSTGVLLAGQKGSGKTLLAKKICVDAAASREIPTIIVNDPIVDDNFCKLLQDMDQPAILLFDEFEKTFEDKKGDQNSILTLLDGVFSSNKLFLLTCNDIYAVNDHLKNRPGRIFYSMEFGGMAESAIREYCVDRLENQEHLELVCKVGLVFDHFNFDMLSALVEDMNRYGEDPYQSLEMLNIRPHAEGYSTYDIEYLYDGKPIKWIGANTPDTETINGSPIAKKKFVFWLPSHNKKINNAMNLIFDQKNLISFDSATGTFLYSTDQPKYTVHFHRQKMKTFDFKSLSTD